MPHPEPAPSLFEGCTWPEPRAHRLPPPAKPLPDRAGLRIDPAPDDHLLDLFARVQDPDDTADTCRLYLGSVESRLPSSARMHPDAVLAWTASRPRRTVTAQEVLSAPATVHFVKEMFNVYFRDDLYGALDQAGAVLLSQGTVDEATWGLPASIKACVEYALRRDWYGYSHSCGREAAREAIARYESVRLPSVPYSAENVAITMGGTFAISALADFLLTGQSGRSPALCAIPNYPPLVSSVARRVRVQMVPTPTTCGRTHLDQLIAALESDTPLVLLQTATNPTGSLVDEDELEELIHAASPHTVIVLDECHEWLGPAVRFSPARASRNVVRVSSLSKNWSAPGVKLGWFAGDADLVAAYYEYASTNYGGPPSFFYTALEVLARFERWRLCCLDRLGPEQQAEFERHYGLRLADLATAYRSYCAERAVREADLVAARDFAIAALSAAGVGVLGARYSINIAAQIPGFDDSYVAFRQLFHDEKVAIFPGLLTFCLSGGIGRLTTGRPPTQLRDALARVERAVERQAARLAERM